MIIHMKWLIRNIILMFIGLSLFSCKATTFKKVTINASKEEVWLIISKLGDLDHYSALDSASLTPSVLLPKVPYTMSHKGKTTLNQK